MNDKQLWEIAKQRATFKVHVAVYVTIIILLAAINLITSSSYLWFLFPALGWGVGLVFHYLSAYVFDPNAREREYQKLKAQQKKR